MTPAAPRPLPGIPATGAPTTAQVYSLAMATAAGAVEAARAEVHRIDAAIHQLRADRDAAALALIEATQWQERLTTLADRL